MCKPADARAALRRLGLALALGALAACAGSREARRAEPAAEPTAAAEETAPAAEAREGPADAEPPEGARATEEPPAASERRAGRAPEAALRQARESVAALAQRSWADARVAAADALEALADALPSGPPEAREVIRASATELRERDDIGFEHTERIQRGLEAALAALAEAGGGDRALQPWLRAAGEAVGALRPEVPFDLHRAPIQDAFRAVVDAFLAGALRDGPAVSRNAT